MSLDLEPITPQVELIPNQEKVLEEKIGIRKWKTIPLVLASMPRWRHLPKMQHLDLDLEPVGEMDQREVAFLDQEITTSKDTQQKQQRLEVY